MVEIRRQYTKEASYLNWIEHIIRKLKFLGQEMKSKIYTYFIFIKFLSLAFIPLSYADTNSDKSLTSYQILKTKPIDKIKGSKLKSDPRLIVVGDFNNDGINEYLGLSMSQKYLLYAWGDKRLSKKDDKKYWEKGVELSKDPSWSAEFNTHTLGENNSLNGKWKIKIEGSQACVHPTQIIPSYFNNDNFVDFLIVCHGYDAKPFPGEHSYVMMSNGANSYKINRLTNKIGFYHDGATADFNKDGQVDILLVDKKSKKLRVYINNKGKFKEQKKYFSQFDSFKNYASTEILDVNDDGYFDIFLSGNEASSYKPSPTIILLGNKASKFSKSNKIIIPKVKDYGVVLDIIKHEKFVFIVRTGSKNRYQGAMIQLVDLDNISNFKVIKNDKMRWLDRIFKLNENSDKLKFGSLTDINKGIDFIFDGKDMKPIK